MIKKNLHILLFTLTFAFANIYINNTNTLNVQNFDALTINASLTIGSIAFEEVNINNNNYFQINIDGSYPSTKSFGSPDLPKLNSLIEIPHNADISIEIINDEFIEYNLNDYNLSNPIIPVQMPISKSEAVNDIEFLINQEIYNSNNYFSYELISVNKKGFLREVEIANLMISPIEYNPIENKIKVHHNIEFKLHFSNTNIELTNQKKQSSYSPYFEPIYQTSLINYNPHYESRENDFVEGIVSYIIVADQSFENTLAPFIEWKTQKGYHMIVAYTNEIGSSAT